jgi:hypothetical protein
VTTLNFADYVTLAGVVVGTAALIFTAYSVRRGNKNSSAASLIALNEGLRQAWERFLSASDEATKEHQFADLLNTLEIASALCVKRVLVGVSRELLSEYLSDVMDIFDHNEDAKRRAEALVLSETTFKYLVQYRTTVRKRSRRTTA